MRKKVDAGNDKSFCESVEAKKNTFFRKKFFLFETKLAFTQLRQAFIDVQILHHFFSEQYICIQINLSNYMIDAILSKLISN